MRAWPCLVAAILISGSLRLSLLAQQIDESTWGKNTAGSELATHEGPRERTASETVLIYNILGRGFPADKTYDLWFWTLGKKPVKAMAGVSFDKRGLLVCSGMPGFCKGEGADDPINIKATAMLAEPKRFGVISTDGKVAGFAEAVPFPVEAKDKNCKLSVVRLTQLADSLELRGSGFIPHDTLTVKESFSGGDLVKHPIVAADGTWRETVAVREPGGDSGTAAFTVAGKTC
jgi:hypothetical protein